MASVVAQKLFADEDPIGRVVRILGAPFEVVGVLEEKGTAGVGDSQDDVAFVPLGTARNRLIGASSGDRNAVGYILASATSGETIPVAIKEIDELLQQRHHVVHEKTRDSPSRRPPRSLRRRKPRHARSPPCSERWPAYR